MDKNNFSNHIMIKNVHIKDEFWSDIQALVRDNVLPYQYEALNDLVPDADKSYCVENFEKASKIVEKINNGETLPTYPVDKWHYDENNSSKDAFKGWVFQDSDAYKWLEAVAYSLINKWDDALYKKACELIELICSAQLQDGYLNTYYIINNPQMRFTNLKDFHELYCFGHLAEGAVAFFNATGNDKLLKATCKYADLLCDTFGEDKLRGYGGHEIAELALVKLYNATKQEKYLDLATFFINERGTKPYYFDIERSESTDGRGYVYNQAHMPVREQREAVGHAVRGVYLYTGMTDIARQNMDEELYSACKSIWDDIAHKKMYITGGIGSTVDGEAFTYAYDLPNDLAYCETCASIGLSFFAQRMLEIEPNSEYADIMERAIYNCILAGMSEDGKRFFYVNPLEALPLASATDSRKRHVKPVRQKWYDCACCPPNLARFLSSLGEYCATENDEAIFIHQYVGGDYQFNNAEVKISSSYVKDGNVEIDITPQKAITLAVRVPAWCDSYSISKNHTIKNGYAYISIDKNDSISLQFSPEIRLVKCSNLVRENVGKVAVMRGATVFCCEEIDNGENLQMLLLDPKKPMKYDGNCIIAQGYRELPDKMLYQTLNDTKMEPVEIRLIPYHKWANRGENEMLVYLRIKN